AVVFTLTRADFRNLLTQHPEISLGMARILAERLESSTRAQIGIDLFNLHKVIPVSFVNNSVTLAMVNPNNLVAFDDVRRYLKGAMIEPKICTEEDFRRFLETTYAQIMGLDPGKREDL